MPDDPPIADRVTKLEELLAHQEHQFQQLNESVLTLLADHERVKATLLQRIAQLETGADSQSATLDPDEKPPHY